MKTLGMRVREILPYLAILLVVAVVVLFLLSAVGPQTGNTFGGRITNGLSGT